MKKIRLLALLLALCLLCACGTPAASSTPEASQVSEASVVSAPEEAPAAEEASVPEEPSTVEEEIDCDEVFAVVHTNDVHGFIEVEPYVKAVADDLKAQYGEENVVTVSAGDVFAGGKAVAHLYNGELIPPVMETAGYDILVPGNNDFNLGGETLISLGHASQTMTTLCANLFVLNEDGTAGDSVFDRSMEFTTAGGVKIGFFGLTISGGPAGDLFSSTGSVETAQEMVTALQESGCGVIIGIGHTGWNDDLVTPSSNDTTSAALVKEVPGMDAYVDGHTHSVIGGGNGWVCPETGTLVNQASCKGEAVGVMTFYLKDGEVVEKKAELITGDDLYAYTPDAATQDLVDADLARLAEDAGEPFINSEYFLNGLRTSESTDGRSVRTDETNLGDLMTDAIRSVTGADVAMIPGFKLRSSMEKGDITIISLYDVFANGADIYVQELTGQELLEKMAASLGDLPNESTQFNQWSGVSFGYVLGEDKTFTIVDPMVGGEPLDPEKTYTVAMDMGGPDAPADQVPVVSGMEEVSAAVGEYLKSGDAVIFPDEPTPDNRVIPMEEVPADAVTYEITVVVPEGMGGPGAPPPKP